MSEALLQIDIDQLMPDPNQPRKIFSPEELGQLADSIRARGVLLPLRVLWDAERKAWRILTGESRWRAAKMAGLPCVPCLTVEGEVSETDILADQIIENTCRHDLLPMELARALAKLKILRGSTAQQLAAQLGISGATISRCESLLALPASIQDMIDTGLIAPASAYEISRLPDIRAQMELAQAVATRRLNRSQVVSEVREQIGVRHRTSKPERWSSKLDTLSVTVSASVPLTRDDLIKLSDHLRKEAKKLPERAETPPPGETLKAS